MLETVVAQGRHGSRLEDEGRKLFHGRYRGAVKKAEAGGDINGQVVDEAIAVLISGQEVCVLASLETWRGCVLAGGWRGRRGM